MQPITDTTDADLYEAEHHAKRLAAALQHVLHPALGFDADREAITALEEWNDYCRPSCRYLDAGDCAMGEAGCTCPCAHDDTNAPSPTASPR